MRITMWAAVLSLALLVPGQAFAAFTEADATALGKNAQTTVNKFKSETSDSKPLLEGAKGMLVCPTITKGGFIAGLQSGKCALMVGGEAVNYYRASSAKFGFLAGVEQFSMILLFNTQASLDKFRAGDREWEVGADLSISVAKIGAGGSIDTTNLKTAVVAFVFGQKGLMGDASLSGTTFGKLTPEKN